MTFPMISGAKFAYCQAFFYICYPCLLYRLIPYLLAIMTGRFIFVFLSLFSAPFVFLLLKVSVWLLKRGVIFLSESAGILPATAKETGPPKFVTSFQQSYSISEGQSCHMEARLTPVDDPLMKVNSTLLLSLKVICFKVSDLIKSLKENCYYNM